MTSLWKEWCRGCRLSEDGETQLNGPVPPQTRDCCGRLRLTQLKGPVPLQTRDCCGRLVLRCSCVSLQMTSLYKGLCKGYRLSGNGLTWVDCPLPAPSHGM